MAATDWRRPPAVVVGLACLLVALAAGLAAQRPPAAPALPPLSMTCPHHPDVIESTPGSCPFCRMALVPVRLAPAWTCPFHAATIADAAGACPICRRALVPVTVSVTWTCPGSTAGHLEPGTCANGSPTVLTRTLRPHGDHNPRHGGQFFMASDNWHHVEGTHPAARVFRLYVYDDYARPLPADRLRRVRARVVTEERFDPATRRTTDVRSAPLRVAGNGAFLEARIDSLALPASMTAKVHLTPDAQEQRFDFTFAALTKDTAPASARDTRPPAPPKAALAPAAAPVPATTPEATGTAAALESSPAPEPDAALVVLPIPETVPEILEHLRTRNRQIGELVERGDFGAVWVPAFQAKDLAIALEARLSDLDAARREPAASALQRVVRLSWLLDAHGDTGNRQNVATAYAAFSTAVGDVLAAVSGAAR